MRSTLALFVVAVSALAKPMPQGVTSAISPETVAPEGCSPSYPGPFEVTVVDATSSFADKRDVEKRQEASILTLRLSGGVLTDQEGRTGYIASNRQFQFDGPPQAGAIYTSGFSICANNSLALGGDSIFYQCYSGGFYNLYDRSWAPQCSPIRIEAMGGGASSVDITELADGQPGGSTVLPSVSEQSDGQPIVTQPTASRPQRPTALPVTQLIDGQPQGPTAVPVTRLTSGQPRLPTGIPLTRITEVQPQVPTGVPVTQITDGQPQVPTGAPVTGQSGGRPVATSPGGVLVSVIPDGQPQAPAATGNASITASPPAEFTGAASTPIYGLGAVAAGLMGATRV
ncbi:hypothetical protein K432DRAFT_424851 [Lepidopterella palustris CBS 459.81]|uniref:Cell wall mannoprotein PIR1-like C-terminal domain-containing protein n=1 Tax=Lepidopterella palustris CBS 459.81 TaxID=1314670 RepID=A0A8E2JGX7_9PEZI|nr:hypothetical protein K432DRAFT_424851 [Lepidopterella palustris CBS 459.81]